MGSFELALAVLFVFAILDLSVGVSNDAVNFLNSAIGSRVATRRTILIIAGLGVLVGSLFSSGIMEVARSGIFRPELFVFADVMIVFLAVMLADVILLDLFNTLALPTSTTVSIVFELLGAAVAIATFAVFANPDAGNVLDYVNVERALMIIGGIGLSIVVAFVAGTVIQFFSRLLFTFDRRRHGKVIRILWAAIALTAISFFLIVKGLKGVGFVPAEWVALIQSEALLVLGVAFVVWSVILSVLTLLRIDVIALSVLAGTFSLALAFASNDLVNFIGVPLAGLSAYEAWQVSGVAPDQLTMEALAGPVTGHTGVLVFAGAVMVLTLWFSAKARGVTQTEVNLGRQGEGAERFRPGPVSRGIVRTALSATHVASQVMPARWQAGLARRFAREQHRSDQTAEAEQPAFDTLRASVNLTVASILIVFATSLKLPLSTTFVSFMVAMGTSLADRAWGRDAAAYRLAGVFSVVGGWFITAAAAFALAATFATVLKLFGGSAMVVLAALALTALWHTHRHHQRQTRMQALIQAASPDPLDRDALALRSHLNSVLRDIAPVIDDLLKLLVRRKRKLAKKLRRLNLQDDAAVRRSESEFVSRLEKIRPRIEPWLFEQLDVLGLERELMRSTRSLSELTTEHVLNEHSPPSERVAVLLNELRETFRQRIERIVDDSAEGVSATSNREIGQQLDKLTELILQDLYERKSTNRNTTLMLAIVLELTDLQRELARVAGDDE